MPWWFFAENLKSYSRAPFEWIPLGEFLFRFLEDRRKSFWITNEKVRSSTLAQYGNELFSQNNTNWLTFLGDKTGIHFFDNATVKTWMHRKQLIVIIIHIYLKPNTFRKCLNVIWRHWRFKAGISEKHEAKSDTEKIKWEEGHFKH